MPGDRLRSAGQRFPPSGGIAAVTSFNALSPARSAPWNMAFHLTARSSSRWLAIHSAGDRRDSNTTENAVEQDRTGCKQQPDQQKFVKRRSDKDMPCLRAGIEKTTEITMMEDQKFSGSLFQLPEPML